MDLRASIERLKASKAQFEQASIEAGKFMGRKMACDHLEYDQLVAISKIDDSQRDEDSAYDSLRKAIDPEGSMTACDFADYINDGEEVNGLFAIGFIEGAQEFYSEVEHEL